ncbi:MAG: hypothetical protein H5T98_03885 [Syntrophomonadaceae bacterium]|nr:hypothetical protein [Syntrophomonadaceae bacterium]
MPIIDSYGYIGAILSIVIIGLGIDVVVHLTKQVKNAGKWKINYGSFAIFGIGTMLIMFLLTLMLRGNDVFGNLVLVISGWLILLGYMFLRSLRRSE